MFYLDYLWKNFLLTLKLIARGEWGRVCKAIHARIYVRVQYVLFWFRAPGLRAKAAPAPDAPLSVATEHRVAFTSPDHIVPFGTKYNNSTNRKFVVLMNAYFRERFPSESPAFMDLGCSGGQAVADFIHLRWVGVGLEGSDYSLKHKRANWKELSNTHLFTCDITKPFEVQQGGKPRRFHLITAWEVMEHIHPDDLPAIFGNIRKHLVEGGVFVASTNSHSSVVDGVELHQTRMTNAEWHTYITKHFPDLEKVDLGLKIHQYVRFDFGEPSFLVYRKRKS